ncbi:MAG: tetratricopeptide repeat protein [Bacteroidota bacterium]
MDFGNFDYSPKISNLISQYEATTQNGGSAFFEEESFLQLIDYYEQEGMYNRAFETLDHAIECHRFSSSFYEKKANFLIDVKKENEALEVLNEAEILTPNCLSIQLLKVKAFSFLSMSSEALAIIEELKQRTFSSKSLSEVYLAEAIIYERLEQYDFMFNALQAALNIDNSNQAALEKMWFCTELSKKYEASLVLHDELLVHNAYSSRAWYNLAHAHAYLGNYEDAIEAYEFAYLIDEDFEFAYRDRAEICYELHYYKEALASYEEVLGLFEPDADLYLRAGQCHFHLGHIEKAKHNLTQAVFLEPVQEEEIFFYLGRCYAIEENHAEAIRFYQKAIDADAHREEFHLHLAFVYTAQKEYKLAISAFQMATETAPEDATYWFHYAKFLIQIGKTKKAWNVLQEAEIYTISTDVAHCRVACLLMLNQRDEAFKLFNETLEEESRSYRFLFGLKPELKNDAIINAIVSFHEEVSGY